MARKDKGKEVAKDDDLEAGAASPPSDPPTVGGSEPEDTTSLASDAAVTTSCFGLSSKQTIPRRRRWNCLCFSVDRELVTFATKCLAGFVLLFFSLGMLAWLMADNGNAIYISIIYGILTGVAGFFFGSAAKFKKAVTSQ
jgi:hypothetical protein